MGGKDGQTHRRMSALRREPPRRFFAHIFAAFAPRKFHQGLCLTALRAPCTGYPPQGTVMDWRYGRTAQQDVLGVT